MMGACVRATPGYGDWGLVKPVTHAADTNTALKTPTPTPSRVRGSSARLLPLLWSPTSAPTKLIEYRDTE
ncbi:hypothetical protein KQX54_019139 [Cotesia glomerata]|uniref:Uncharacterized protein n=1 Tax=Cotesia glomerata TaxID=32391 RepID=A0AAV7HZM5_COTGL|nr:hypothetical protein KQX54_019139 [Cotesia glomerata]